MLRIIVLMLFLLTPIEYARSISITDLPSQLQSCMGSGDCIVDTSVPFLAFGQMEAYSFADNLLGSPVTGYALRYSLLPPSGEGSTPYGGELWLTVQSSYDLSLDSNLVTVYTDTVSPQPNNILFGDSNGLDIDVAMSNTALLSGSGFELGGLDANNMVIYQANMSLQSDFGGDALLPCAAEGCSATADLNLIYINYVQSGNTATLQINPGDSRSLLYELTSGYDESPENGGYFTSQAYYVAAVPLPPAVWLFGTGLLSLVGMARRKKAA